MRPIVFLSLLLLLLAACQTGLDIPLLATTTAVPVLTPTPLQTVKPTATPYSLAGLRQFLAETEAVRIPDRQARVNRYLAQLSRSPIVAEDAAAFLWQGKAAEVAVTLINPFGSVDTAIQWPMSQLPETDLWVLITPLAAGSRLEYLLSVDGRLQLDTLNPEIVEGRGGPNSVMSLPGYAPPPELAADRTPAPQGSIATHTLPSAALGQTRTIFVYTPAAEYSADRPLPTIYLLDGSDYLNLAAAPELLDWIIAAGEIPPVAAVFIPPIDRRTEYDRNDAFGRFLIDEVVPFVQQTYGTSRRAADTAIIGPDLGGLMALHMAVNTPNIFGLAAAQSGDFSPQSEALTRQLRLQQAAPIRLYLSTGLYDSAADSLEANRRLADVLALKGYDYHFEEVAANASWGMWEEDLGRGLRFLFNP